MGKSLGSGTARRLAARSVLIAFAISGAMDGPVLNAANTGTQNLLTITGSGAALAFGDYVTNTGALDTQYSIFLEIPEGLAQFDVDLFDADILNGDGTGTIRDRARSGGTTVQYRLYDPNGTLVATLNCGGTTCADNAWTTLASLPIAGPGDHVLDQFGTVAYNNNNGTVNWSGNWIEANDNGQPGSGEIQILVPPGRLGISDNGGAPSTITRSVDLSPTGLDFSSATLSFTFSTTAQVDGTDQMAVEVSSNGSTWVRLATFAGAFLTVQNRSYNITSYIGANTSVRFIRAQGYGGANEIFYADDVRIEEAGPPLPFDAGHWELQIDQSSAITTGNDINGLGFRVHDGDPTSGGTEINAYLRSFAPYGSNDANLSRTYEHYPYLTSGCDFDLHDFDWDSVGSVQLDGPISFSQTGTVSGDNAWNTSPITTFTSLARSEEYGIWTLSAQISGPSAGVGNYATLYTSDFTGSGTPPGSQPEPGALRIYLPSDGADGNSSGSGPGKFHLSQLLAFSTGSNPPTPGNPGRYGITVIAENPASASGDVTFDSTNLITANVPGGNVTFVSGSEQTDTGTVSFNGGNVEWDPGTLDPGDVAVMWYQVEVTDDGSASILATGSPGSNGTRAVFTDETGELDSSWADGICELVVDLQGPTAVTLKSFEAYVDGGGVVVEWITDAEAGTIGFDLWRHDSSRKDFVKVNGYPLTGLLSSPQGGVYRFRDDRAPTRGDLTYMLVETESLGREHVYGPFTAEINWNRRADAVPAAGNQGFAAAVDFAKFPHAPNQPPTPRRANATDKPGRPPIGPPTALKIGVGEPGLYRVQAQEIADGLGLPLQVVVAHLASGQLSLTQAGSSVGWMASSDGSALEFYGEKTGSLYSAENIYRLAVAVKDRPRVLPRDPRGSSGRGGALSAPFASTTTFRKTVRVDRDLFPVLALPLPEGTDFWFWDYVRFGDPTHESKSFDFDLPGVAGGIPSQGALSAHLQGAALGQHEVELFLNGTWIGFAALNDLESITYTTRFFNQSLLNDGDNILEIVAVDGGLVFLDYLEVEFDRSYDARFMGSLHHRGDENREVIVTGFAGPDVRVFDLTDPRNPKRILGASVREIGGSYSVAYKPESGDTLHLAIEGGGVLQPVSLTPDYPSNLRSPQLGADYLILTTAEMVETAQSLAEHRQSQEHITRVIDVADVFDEFNDGMSHPEAIREFLIYAFANWATAPRFVFIAANGTWDYRDSMGFGDNLVPPMLQVASSEAPGLYATDFPYGDVVGDDRVWEIAVGRVSVTGPADLQAYIDKIIAYENDFDAGPRDSVLVLTDNPDGSGEYLSDGLALSALLPPGLTPVEVQLGPLDLIAAREQLFGALDMGVPVMTYHGHAGATTLAHEGLLTSADVPSLSSQGRVPIVNAVTCFVATFANPGFDSLAEALVNHADGGAAAFWASVYYSSNAQTQFLADRFFRQVFHEGETILGEAVLGAIRNAANHVSDSTLRRTAILGDPALRFQHEAVSVPPEPPTPGE